MYCFFNEISNNYMIIMNCTICCMIRRLITNHPLNVHTLSLIKANRYIFNIYTIFYQPIIVGSLLGLELSH